ncbi:MAG: hypothetical protein HY884_06930 [Deltaproteobacteria bacterium]|nr:hypothetical protein [Deltaproteobacteria bacterium]
MATWAKIKFYHVGNTMMGAAGSTLTASSTASGDYSAAYIYNMLEVNSWKAANTTTPMYITFDGGSAQGVYNADFLAIIGHNLATIGGTITLQYSTDNFAADINDAFTGFAPATDAVILKEFTAPGAKRYWRLKITGTLSAAPYMAICIWGNKVELDYASASFDPYEQDVKAQVNLSQGGYVTGIHTQYTERSLNLRFDDADSALYAKVKTWWDSSGLKNFFAAWETANNPNDVYLMRPDTRFSNPLKLGGAYRDISIQLKGRKE